MAMDDKDVFHYLFSNYAPYIYAALNNEKKKGTIPDHVDIGDLIAGDEHGYSPVVHGLLRAVHTFDPKMGSSLESHIYRHVVGKARDYIKSKDVSQTDVSRASKYSKQNPQQAERQVITVKPSASMRMATESLGISGGEDDGLQFNIERDAKRKFIEQNPQFIKDELARKVGKYEKAHSQPSGASPTVPATADKPVVQAPAPEVQAPAAAAPKPAPKVSIRRKGIETALSPEQKDRMVRVDSAKAARKDGGQ